MAARSLAASGWRGTVGHNWGSEHADSWVWLHAADFSAAPEVWLDLVLARIRVGPARSPWTAMGALSLAGDRIVLGGLGRRPRVDARPGRLTADVPSPHARLQLSVITGDDDPVAVPYRSGARLVREPAAGEPFRPHEHDPERVRGSLAGSRSLPWTTLHPVRRVELLAPPERRTHTPERHHGDAGRPSCGYGRRDRRDYVRPRRTASRNDDHEYEAQAARVATLRSAIISQTSGPAASAARRSCAGPRKTIPG